MEWAFSHHLRNLKIKYFQELRKLTYKRIEKENEAAHQRFQYLKRNTFMKWVNIIPELLDENYELEKIENQKIFNFRVSCIGRRILEAWKVFVQDSKEEKLKELYTQAMWEKAQLWLSESNN